MLCCDAVLCCHALCYCAVLRCNALCYCAVLYRVLMCWCALLDCAAPHPHLCCPAPRPDLTCVVCALCTCRRDMCGASHTGRGGQGSTWARRTAEEKERAARTTQVRGRGRDSPGGRVAGQCVRGEGGVGVSSTDNLRFCFSKGLGMFR